jgi:hypothetical protein
MTDFESDFADLIDKLKDHKGLVTATTVQNKNIARGKDLAQYRRDLLACAVKDGYAWDNWKRSTDNKYGIYFANVENSRQKCFFDHVVLMDDLIGDMPPAIFLDWGLSLCQCKKWEVLKAQWIEVYKAFCLHQNGEILSTKNLYFSKDKDINRYRLVMVKMYIAMYEAIKIGWDELPFSKTPLFKDHNALFVRYLHNKSTLELLQFLSPQKEQMKYNSTYSNLIENRYHHRAGIHHPEQYGDDYELKGGDKDVFIKSLKFLDESAQESIPEGWRGLIFPVSQMLYCLEQSSNPQVIEASKKWREAVSALDDLAISLIRPLRESVANRKNFLEEP